MGLVRDSVPRSNMNLNGVMNRINVVSGQVEDYALIERALNEAEPGDAVVIAGKGHETSQVIGDERRLFDDRVVARAVLARRRARARVP